MTEWIKHQLFIHLDYHPEGQLDVRYDYPLSTPPIPPQTVTISGNAIPEKLKNDLDFIRECLVGKIPTKLIRTPHAEVKPRIVPTMMTIVIQNQTRSSEIPLARLYYQEWVDEITLQNEGQVRMIPDDFVEDKRLAWERIRDKAKGIAWHDYWDIKGFSKYSRDQ